MACQVQYNENGSHLTASCGHGSCREMRMRSAKSLCCSGLRHFCDVLPRPEARHTQSACRKEGQPQDRMAYHLLVPASATLGGVQLGECFAIEIMSCDTHGQSTFNVISSSWAWPTLAQANLRLTFHNHGQENRSLLSTPVSCVCLLLLLTVAC